MSPNVFGLQMLFLSLCFYLAMRFTSKRIAKIEERLNKLDGQEP